VPRVIAFVGAALLRQENVNLLVKFRRFAKGAVCGEQAIISQTAINLRTRKFRFSQTTGKFRPLQMTAKFRLSQAALNFKISPPQNGRSY